jgi:hypothetical protein
MLRCRFKLVSRIINHACQSGIESSDNNTNYEHLSLNEKAFQKGHNYVTVLSDVTTAIEIDLVKEITKKPLKCF